MTTLFLGLAIIGTHWRINYLEREIQSLKYLMPQPKEGIRQR